jgi:hypothetical protein
MPRVHELSFESDCVDFSGTISEFTNGLSKFLKKNLTLKSVRYLENRL